MHGQPSSSSIRWRNASDTSAKSKYAETTLRWRSNLTARNLSAACLAASRAISPAVCTLIGSDRLTDVEADAYRRAIPKLHLFRRKHVAKADRDIAVGPCRSLINPR